jgi:hypothetical protein
MKAIITSLLFCSFCLPGFVLATGDAPAEAAVTEVMRAAKAGDATAQLQLADMYDLGQGVPRDFVAAAKWYQRAAEQGNAQAQFALAEMYKNGDGVEQNMDSALHWYRKSASQGNAGAQLLLGVIYESGSAVRQDFGEAARWYLLSAEGGDARAQLLLANLYNIGQGVGKNAVVAFALYTVSLENDARGNPAGEHRAALARNMTLAEIESAAALAAEMMVPGKLGRALDRYLSESDTSY